MRQPPRRCRSGRRDVAAKADEHATAAGRVRRPRGAVGGPAPWRSHRGRAALRAAAGRSRVCASSDTERQPSERAQLQYRSGRVGALRLTVAGRGSAGASRGHSRRARARGRASGRHRRRSARRHRARAASASISSGLTWTGMPARSFSTRELGVRAKAAAGAVDRRRAPTRRPCGRSPDRRDRRCAARHSCRAPARRRSPSSARGEGARASRSSRDDRRFGLRSRFGSGFGFRRRFWFACGFFGRGGFARRFGGRFGWRFARAFAAGFARFGGPRGWLQRARRGRAVRG